MACRSFSRAVEGDTRISACIIELNWRVKIQKAERGNILLTYKPIFDERFSLTGCTEAGGENGTAASFAGNV